MCAYLSFILGSLAGDIQEENPVRHCHWYCYWGKTLGPEASSLERVHKPSLDLPESGRGGPLWRWWWKDSASWVAVCRGGALTISCPGTWGPPAGCPFTARVCLVPVASIVFWLDASSQDYWVVVLGSGTRSALEPLTWGQEDLQGIKNETGNFAKHLQ